ncbi:MAG: insulinase family protein, partial [Phycisphaerae bacterium]|nr:insulinase family protein [Phycisphaerae bacterium]
QATVLDDSFDGAIEILADVIIRPTFSKKELEILRPKTLVAIDRQDEEVRSQLMKFFRSKFFTDSPYRFLPSGNKEVAAAATPQQIAAYHRAHVKAGASVLAVCGNFDAAAARKKIERLFAEMPTGGSPMATPPTRKVAADGSTHVLKTDMQVAGVMIAAPGVTVDNLPDRCALDVLDAIISGYHLPSGWLHEELRGRRLVYVVHAINWAGLAPGAFQVYAIAQPENAQRVAEIIKRNLSKASRYTPTQAEIDQAINGILTAELLHNQRMSSLAISTALDELYGLGYDFRRKMESHYRKVTPADVLRVGRKYLSGGVVAAFTTPKPELLEQETPDEQKIERRTE